MEPIDSAKAVPAVSVVVPCFNGGCFLDGTMAALERQTFRDFEVIIVDDGSTDDLTARKLAQLDGQARIVRQTNKGAAAARNTGIREARADIVFTFDCDDSIEPTFLAETVAALQAAPADVGMAFTYTRLTGAESGVLPRYFNRFDLLFSNIVSTALVLRKNSWRAAGGYDETMRQGYEDWEFSLRLARAGFRGIGIAKPLYLYRVASDQETSSISSSIHVKRLYAKLWREIRNRHAESYRPLALLRLWWASRDGTGRVALWKGLMGCALALVLPDTLFNELYARLHRRRTWPQPDAPQARINAEAEAPPNNDALTRSEPTRSVVRGRLRA
jgi:glycosyltransferase involved in cell wall biosynthesis